jgi:hypothetical protein
MRTPYLEELRVLAVNCQEVLRNGFRCSDRDIEEFIKSLESTLHQFTADYIKRLFRDINTNLLRRFNKDFKKDANGKNREWRDMEEPLIRDLWAKVRAQMLELINDFKYIRLPKAILSDVLEESSKS